VNKDSQKCDKDDISVRTTSRALTSIKPSWIVDVKIISTVDTSLITLSDARSACLSERWCARGKLDLVDRKAVCFEVNM